MESSSKKARVLGYPEAAVNDITELKKLIESSQRESLWRLLEEKKAECALFADRTAQLEDEVSCLRLRAASFSCLFHKLSLLSGRQFVEGPAGIENPDGLAGELWNTIMECQNAPFLKQMGKDINVEARLHALEEELRVSKKLLLQKDAEILSLLKQKTRIELASLRASDVSSGDGVALLPSPVLEESGKQVVTVLPDKTAELEMAQTLAARRLEEVHTMDKERAQLIYKNRLLQESLKRIPEEFAKEPRKAYDMLQEINSLKSENSRLRRAVHEFGEKLDSTIKKKDAKITEMEALLTNKRVDSNKTLDSIQAEASRMRKERDNMRELYEHANSQVLAANKTMSHLQATVEKLQTRLGVGDAQTERLGKIMSKLNDISVSDGHDGLQEIIQLLRDNEASLYQELETIGKSFDELASQNQLLTRQLAERDEALGKMTSEKLRAEFSCAQIRKDAEIAVQKAQALEVGSIERIANAEVLEARLRKEVVELENKILARQTEDEKTQQLLQDLKGENSRLKAQLDHIASLRLEESLAESTRQLETVQVEKRRLEGELDTIRAQLKRHTEAKGIPSDDLEKELAMYKKLMKCNSCHIRDKNAIITKCMHVFCRQCLDSRIETRQRKCPNCGDSFGANDVRNIYL